MNRSVVYAKFLNFAKEYREELIDDTLLEKSYDLYDALYSNADSKISEIKLELYEVMCLEKQWNKICSYAENEGFCSVENRKNMAECLEPYIEFQGEFGNKEFSIDFFTKKREMLQEIVALNSKWDADLKQQSVLFKKAKKVLYDKIKKIEREETKCQL